MNFAFSEEQEELRKSVRRFVDDKSPESEVRRLMDTTEGYDPAVWSQMAQQLGLQGLAIQESAKDIQACLGQVAQDLARFEDEHQKLGRHLDNARSAHDAGSRWLGRVGERLQRARASAAVDPPTQAVLPIDSFEPEG